MLFRNLRPLSDEQAAALARAGYRSLEEVATTLPEELYQIDELDNPTVLAAQNEIIRIAVDLGAEVEFE